MFSCRTALVRGFAVSIDCRDVSSNVVFVSAVILALIFIYRIFAVVAVVLCGVAQTILNPHRSWMGQMRLWEWLHSCASVMLRFGAVETAGQE